MSDIPEMSVQSTLTETTIQEENISHSKTTVNALADVSNSTGSYSKVYISPLEHKKDPRTKGTEVRSGPWTPLSTFKRFNEYLKKYLKVFSDQINQKKSLCTL